MITKYMVYRFLETAEREAAGSGGKTKLDYELDTKEDVIRSKETHEVICTVDEYVSILRRKNHCDFEAIYDDHACLSTIYRCKECGAVIFGGDDERWDPNLECPSCGGYKTSLEWWSGEDIKNDPEKQKMIEFFIGLQKDMDEVYERRKRRNGLNDWEIWKKKFKNKKRLLEITLTCCNLFTTGLKGLSIEFAYYSRKKPDDLGYTRDKYLKVPLSPYAVYMWWIHRRTVRYSKKYPGKT